jgi:hypothetical protein
MYKMKKVVLAILTLLYITSSVGITLHSHYCMDMPPAKKMDNAGKNHDNCSSVKIEKRESSCCKFHNKLIKISDDQQLPEQAFTCIHHGEVIVPLYYSAQVSVPAMSLTNHGPLCYAPPADVGIPIYLLNRVFRI